MTDEPHLGIVIENPLTLLRLMHTLLASLRLRPGPNYSTIPTSRHRSSRIEQYGHDETKNREFAIW